MAAAETDLLRAAALAEETARKAADLLAKQQSDAAREALRRAQVQVAGLVREVEIRDVLARAARATETAYQLLRHHNYAAAREALMAVRAELDRALAPPHFPQDLQTRPLSHGSAEAARLAVDTALRELSRGPAPAEQALRAAKSRLTALVGRAVPAAVRTRLHQANRALATAHRVLEFRQPSRAVRMVRVASEALQLGITAALTRKRQHDSIAVER